MRAPRRGRGLLRRAGAIVALAGALALAVGDDAAAAALPFAPGKPILGVSTQHGPAGRGELRHFEHAAGHPVAVDAYFEDFTQPFNARYANAVWRHGAVPLIAWEPWDHRAGPVQPAFALGELLAGRFDRSIRAWASAARHFGHPLLLRFAPEMNGHERPWTPAAGGGTAAQYVAVWRHVHGLFARERASNVSWGWTPAVDYTAAPPLATFYPGDRYVDWVGLDGYNWGTLVVNAVRHSWQSFGQVFGPSVAELQAITHRPLLISEVGSTEQGGDKAAWIRDMFSTLAHAPAIAGIVWFDHDKESDWRIESSPAARAAFAAGVAAIRWAQPPQSRPRPRNGGTSAG